MNATVTWNEIDGIGTLIARNEAGDRIATAAWDEPISASTDSDAVANALFGDRNIVSVDHDGEFVHVVAE